MSERKRRYRRYTRRIEVEFMVDDLTYKGISSDLSERGIFIRTRRPPAPGVEIGIRVFLPNGKVAKLRGVVRHAVRTPYSFMKNGIGVELTEVDDNYIEFFKTEFGVDSTGEEYILMACPNCKVKNRVKRQMLSLGPKCGRCGGPLSWSGS